MPMVHVSVFEWNRDFDMPLHEFVEELQDLLDSVPEQWRPAVRIEFDRYGSDYDTSYGELTVHYERPETDDELSARLESEALSTQDKENRERWELARLKAKYER
jgi:hypothetical protein